MLLAGRITPHFFETVESSDLRLENVHHNIDVINENPL